MRMMMTMMMMKSWMVHVFCRENFQNYIQQDGNSEMDRTQVGSTHILASAASFTFDLVDPT